MNRKARQTAAHGVARLSKYNPEKASTTFNVIVNTQKFILKTVSSLYCPHLLPICWTPTRKTDTIKEKSCDLESTYVLPHNYILK